MTEEPRKLASLMYYYQWEMRELRIIRDTYIGEGGEGNLQQYLIRIKDKSIHQKAALQVSKTQLENKHGALL